MKRHTVLSLILTLFLFACAKSNDGQRCSLDGDCDGSIPSKKLPVQVSGEISCTAQTTKSVYASEEPVSVTINATGGSGVYSFPRYVSSFSGTTTTPTINAPRNVGSSAVAVEASVSIVDTDDRITQCGIRFTVNPAVAATPLPGSTQLACGITPSKYSPMVSEPVTFAIKAVGGTSPYSFELFYPRQGESPKALASVSAGEATVSHAYSWVGFADPTIKVKDAAGGSVWCEIPNRYMNILPRTIPKIYASVSAATVDADGYSTPSKDLYRVTLSTSGFSGINPIDFKYPEVNYIVDPGFSVRQNQGWTGDNVFFVKRLDGLTHNLTLNFVAETTDPVTATVTQSATISVSIKFGDYLACHVDEPTYLFQGVEGLFTVNSFGAGEAIDIAEVVTPSGVTIRKTTSGNAGVLGLTFGAQGFYEVRFKAKSRVDTLKYCNGKSDYVVGAYILPPPSTLTGCEVKPNVTTVSVGAPLRVDIIRKGGGVDLNGYIVTLAPNGSNTVNAGPYSNGPDTSSLDLRLHEIKNYLLSASVREVSTGKTVACQSYVNVVSKPGLAVTVYDIPRGKNNGLAQNWIYRPGSNHVVQNVNVTARRSDCRDRYYSHLHKYGNCSDCEYPGVHGTKEWFGVEYNGFIIAPSAGRYAFRFNVDDGVSLEIDDTTVLSFDGLHAPQSTAVHYKTLTAGEHTIRIRYFQGPSWEVANVFQWQRPNASLLPNGVWEVVPAGSFRLPN